MSDIFSTGNHSQSMSNFVDQQKMQKYQSIANLYKPAVEMAAMSGNAIIYGATMGGALSALLNASISSDSVFTQAAAASNTAENTNSVNAKTADAKTTDAKTTDTKTANTKTADTKNTDTKTADTKNTDAKTADTTSVDTTELSNTYARIIANLGNSYFNAYSRPYLENNIGSLEAKLSPEELNAFRESDENYKKYQAYMKGENIFPVEAREGHDINKPKTGSELAILCAKLNTLKNLPEGFRNTAGVGTIEGFAEQIRLITSGKRETELNQQIEKLEEKTKNYGETHWYNFTKNAKLRKLEQLKNERDNLY